MVFTNIPSVERHKDLLRVAQERRLVSEAREGSSKGRRVIRLDEPSRERRNGRLIWRTES